MKNKLHFEAREGAGRFVYSGEQFDHLVDEFDELLEIRQSGEIDDKRYLAALRQLVVREPDFIDGYAHQAFALYDQGKPKKALEAALAGLTVANRLIPEGFNGHIEWTHLENRPFLRALQSAVLAYVRLRRHKDVVKLIDKMLAYNPNDNQGVRYLLGSEALRAGDKVRAQEVFNDYANYYPPYYYELALTHIISGEWISAATALRQGFCANGYIAETLCGNLLPQPLAIWHGCNFAEPDLADDYIEMYGDLWLRHADGLAFVHWLFNHSRVMVERAAVIECGEKLLWEQDVDARQRILNQRHTLLDSIDNRLSSEIIGKRKNRQGSEDYPWMLMQGRVTLC
ncbi:tetratricopeptide repeat protein [Pseudomonas protegens]|uniref:tetratricopeptide repeat protein n=1 Tax=Pseudomonas protegens TaxID=380021 RepID=UPI00381F892C